MLSLEENQAKIYDFKERYKVILRKEKNYYVVVHPLTLEKIKLNTMGAYILDAYLSLKKKEEIIENLSIILSEQNEKISQWIEEFEGYLVEKAFIKL